MAVTPLPIETRVPEKTPGMRHISSNLRFRPTPGAWASMTVDRPVPVGRPTIDTVGPAMDGETDVPIADARPLPTAPLVREAIATALESLDALEAQAYDAARRFRRLAVDEAHQRLSHLVESSQTLLTLAVITAEAAGSSLETVCADHDLTVERDTQVALSLMIGHQLDSDWPGLARAIEQPFVTALRGWRTVFQALEDLLGPWGHAA